MVKVLFVCLGNICRSPTAQGVFEKVLEAQGVRNQFYVDSAGTGSWHVGKAPDGRAQAAAKQRGYDLSELRARQVSPDDFEQFDYVLAMDRSNLIDLRSLCPADQQHKIALFLNYSEYPVDEVPDPYYGGSEGFSHVLDLIESASQGFLRHVLNDGR